MSGSYGQTWIQDSKRDGNTGGSLLCSLPFRAFLTDHFTLDEASLAVRFETSTVMSMIQGEAATAVQLPMSAKGRKISTAKGGSVTFWGSAGVWSRLALVAVPKGYLV